MIGTLHFSSMMQNTICISQSQRSVFMRYLFPLILALGCASCANTTKPISAAAPNQTGPVIARICGRHDIIIIRAGDSGPTYSLETARGEVLVPNMPLGKLAAMNPALAKRIDTMEDSVMLASSCE